MPSISPLHRTSFQPARSSGAQRPATAAPLAAEDEKNAARARIQQIKERILALRQLLAIAGAKAAPGVLQELRQLAGELKAAAAVLASEPSAASLPGADPANDGRAAYAAQQRMEETQARSTAGKPSASSADERLVAAVRELLASTLAQARQIDRRRHASSHSAADIASATS